MMFLMMMIMTFLAIVLIMLNHPITMSVILLIQTLLLSLVTGFFTQNFWFSYILFLIMVGGMLVLFIYMTSIASNEKFSYSEMINLLLILAILIILSTYWSMDKMLTSMNTYNFNETAMPFNFMLNKFLNYPSMSILFLLIIYLYITLIAIVKISNIKYGPLRQLL